MKEVRSQDSIVPGTSALFLSSGMKVLIDVYLYYIHLKIVIPTYGPKVLIMNSLYRSLREGGSENL